MEWSGAIGNPARHEQIHAGVIAVEHAIDGAQLLKGSAMHRCRAHLRRDSHPHRSFAMQLPMGTATDVPESFHAAGHDVVVRSAQSPVRAEANECGEYQRW